MIIKCVSCLRKHLSLMKSFMKESMDGHGEGGTPDHRIDVEGQINNAQQHAAMIDVDFTLKLRFFRRSLMDRKFKNITFEDMQKVDVFYYYTDVFDGEEISEQIKNKYDSFEKAPVFSNIGTVTCGCKKK